MGKFQWSYEGGGQLLVSEGMQLEMLRRARKIRDAAVASAPYDPADKDDDHYKDHFSVDSGVTEGATLFRGRAVKTRRAYASVTNDHPAAVSIEFGTADTPAHHTMLRAIDAARD